MERGAPLADHFTILGRVVLAREPQGPDREPRCRVRIGFDVAFHKVPIVLFVFWFLNCFVRVAVLVVIFLEPMGCRVLDSRGEPRHKTTIISPTLVGAFGVDFLPGYALSHTLPVVTRTVCCCHDSTCLCPPFYTRKSTMLRGAIRSGAQEETR